MKQLIDKALEDARPNALAVGGGLNLVSMNRQIDPSLNRFLTESIQHFVSEGLDRFIDSWLTRSIHGASSRHSHLALRQQIDLSPKRLVATAA